MELNLNYEKLYFAFIEKYKNQDIGVGIYTEKHHIVPRHAGGGDSKDNLIVLTYRQHVFAHRLLWKTYHKSSDYCAWLMMSGKSSDFKQANLIAIGKANVVSGHLDRIRHLANTDAQRAHAKLMFDERVANGSHAIAVKLAREAWTGCNHTDEWKKNKSTQMLNFYQDESNRIEANKYLDIGRAVRQQKSKDCSENLILNAERNEEFLQESSSKSLNIFISPEGLEFQSPALAAKYYGNVKPHVIENWCKRGRDRKSVV